MHGICTMTSSVLLLALGCDAKPLGSSTGTRPETTGTGGGFATGGSRSSGNGLGGMQTQKVGTGGMTATGGVAGTGGSPVVTCTTRVKLSADNCGAASTGVGSLSVDWQYEYIRAPFQGYAYVFISPTANPSDTLVCYNNPFGSSHPVVASSSWCGVGTVPADCTGNAVGGIGFNLNQPQWGYGIVDSTGKGFSQPTSPISDPSTVSSVTLAFVNRTSSDLRLQIAQHSESGPIYYCWDIAGMQSPQTVTASAFTKTCWDSADRGVPWDGTGAESVALIIPSQTSEPTPFDACIQGVTFL
jgi:hypothetical protein